jgi:hypothetical protein
MPAMLAPLINKMGGEAIQNTAAPDYNELSLSGGFSTSCVQWYQLIPRC